MKYENLKYLFVKVYGNKYSIPVKCPVDIKVGIGDYVFISGIEDSWPVCKVSYHAYGDSYENLNFDFLGFDNTKPKAIMRKTPTKILSYSDIKGVIQHNGQKYEGGSTGICTLKYVRGGDVVNLDPFIYKNLEMTVDSYEFGLYTEHKFGDVIVSNDNPHFTYENGVLYNKQKTKIFMYLGDDEELNIPETVTYIKEEAFINTKKLRKIVFKGYVEKIENNAFLKCYGLEELIFEQGLYSFEYEYCKHCPKMKKAYCGDNDLSITKGTLHFDKVTVDKGYCYIPKDDNPYYLLYSPILSYGFEDDKGETYHYYLYDAPVFDERPSLKEEYFKGQTPLSEEEYEKMERVINPKVQVIAERLFPNYEYFKVFYGEKYLYFGKEFRHEATYDKDLSTAYFKDASFGFNALVNRLHNQDLLNGITDKAENSIIDRIQNYINNNHIIAIMKYKWFDKIIDLCDTGLLSLEQANTLYDFCKNKPSVDKIIKDTLKDYIYRCKIRRLLLKRYEGMNIFLSPKIIDCNYRDLIIDMEKVDINCTDTVSEKTDFAILGVNDFIQEDKCKKLGIDYCFSSEFAIKNISL